MFGDMLIFCNYRTNLKQFLTPEAGQGPSASLHAIGWVSGEIFRGLLSGSDFSFPIQFGYILRVISRNPQVAWRSASCRTSAQLSISFQCRVPPEWGILLTCSPHHLWMQIQKAIQRGCCRDLSWGRLSLDWPQLCIKCVCTLLTHFCIYNR